MNNPTPEELIRNLDPGIKEPPSGFKSVLTAVSLILAAGAGLRGMSYPYVL